MASTTELVSRIINVYDESEVTILYPWATKNVLGKDLTVDDLRDAYVIFITTRVQVLPATADHTVDIMVYKSKPISYGEWEVPQLDDVYRDYRKKLVQKK